MTHVREATGGTRASSEGAAARPPLAGVTAAVITVSDRRAAGTAQDTAGPAVSAALTRHGAVVEAWVVPDGVAPVSGAIEGAMASRTRVIITVGGTGVGPRDLTPEATEPLLARQLPGIPELIRAAGAASAPAAALSRGLAGVTAGTPGSVIVNAPGSERGALEAAHVVLPLLPHLLSQLDGGDHP